MIIYRSGDLFAGVHEAVDQGRSVVIPHVCNDIGGWGSGFVVPLGKFYPAAREAYLQWAKNGEYYLNPNHDVNLWKGEDVVPFKLGQVQFVQAAENVVVANMIGQHETIRPGYTPIRYYAVAAAIRLVRKYVAAKGIDEIHAPKFGSKLAGGKWTVIEALAEEAWNEKPTYVYELTQEESDERRARALLEKPEILEFVRRLNLSNGDSAPPE